MSPLKTNFITLPKILSYASVLFLIVGLGVYAIWQARFLIEGPEITMVDEPRTEQNERVVTIQGIVKNAKALYLNGLPIVADQNGNFHTGVILENGFSIVRIDAEDRYGRKVSWEKGLVYND